jgi:hypothetical protein
MGQSEPPSSRLSSQSRLFRIGRDSHGNWVVQDQQGLCGGFFVNRADALKFAMFENGNRPQAVIMVPGVLELDMSKKPHDTRPHPMSTRAAQQRAA